LGPVLEREEALVDGEDEGQRLACPRQRAPDHVEAVEDEVERCDLDRYSFRFKNNYFAEM